MLGALQGVDTGWSWCRGEAGSPLTDRTSLGVLRGRPSQEPEGPAHGRPCRWPAPALSSMVGPRPWKQKGLSEPPWQRPGPSPPGGLPDLG